jgi:NusA-like KH domain protein
MEKKLNMQVMRYMNLLARVTRVNAKHCFLYNNTIVYVVSGQFVQYAIGRNNENLKKLSEIIGKRIRVLAEPKGEGDLNQFVGVLVAPAKFEKIEIVDNQENREREVVVYTDGRESKAMMIGRGRQREIELKDILGQYFGVKNLRIM